MIPRMRREQAWLWVLYHTHIKRAWLSLGLACMLLLLAAWLLTLRFLPRDDTPGRLHGFYYHESAAVVPPTLRPTVAPPVLSFEVRPPAVEAKPLPPVPVDAEALAQDAPDMPEAQWPELSVGFPTEWAASPAPKPPARTAHARAEASVPPAPAAGTESHFTPPAYKRAPKPPYPADMRSSRIEGSVRLRIHVDAEGRPQLVEVLAGSGHSEFDSLARAWVLEHWEFEPARRDGVAVPGRVVTSVHFVLG